MRTFKARPTALYLLAGSLLSLCLFTLTLPAQEEQTDTDTLAIIQAMTPGSQHAFLAGQAGTWKATLWAWSDPDAPPLQGTGTVEREMIFGGRVLQEVIKAQIIGMPFEALGHVGYDNVTGQYWATSFDTMSTGVTTLEGTIDETTGRATLEGHTPGPMMGKTVAMRLEIYYDEDGRQITETYMPIPGKGTVMTIKTVYERLNGSE